MSARAVLRRAATTLVVLALASVVVPAMAQDSARPRMEPVDENATDTSWLAFRKRLHAAIAKRDRKFILSIVDRNIRNQTEETRGIAEFRKQWDFDGNDSPLWQELSAALSLGGAWMKHESGQREFCAPYVLPRWPDDVDPVGHGVILVKEALIQEAPSAFSPVIARLAYDIVPVIDWDVPDNATDVKQRWVLIRMGERRGYVPEEHIRSPIEHTACFVKSGSNWRMTGFAPAGGE